MGWFWLLAGLLAAWAVIHMVRRISAAENCEQAQRDLVALVAEQLAERDEAHGLDV